MSTRTERRAAHYHEDIEREMATGHPHTPRSNACDLCMAGACTEHDAKVAAYRVALAAWEAGPKVRPLTRWQLIVGVIQFPFIVVGAIFVGLGWYGHLLIGFNTFRVIGDIGLGDGVGYLLMATLVVVGLSLVVGDGDRVVHRPTLPDMDSFTYNALTERYLSTRPERRPAPRRRPVPRRTQEVMAAHPVTWPADDLPW